MAGAGGGGTGSRSGASAGGGGTSAPPQEWSGFPGANIPALFSNKFFVAANADTTRITFAEGLGGSTINTHTAIVLPTSDAAELGRLLSELVSKIRPHVGQTSQGGSGG